MSDTNPEKSSFNTQWMMKIPFNFHKNYYSKKVLNNDSVS